jgi:hypothetical protein
MERIARPILTGLLVWLLVLSTGALPGRPLDSRHGSRPDGSQSQHRSGIPVKRGMAISRQDDGAKPTCPLKVPALETAIAGPISPRRTACQDTGLAPPGRGRQPLYITLCTLIV